MEPYGLRIMPVNPRNSPLQPLTCRVDSCEPALEWANTMDGGRREKRSPRKFVVLLSNGTKPVVAECASTENVSANGSRVRTVRPWKPNTRVLVKSPLGELRAEARVVSCQILPDTTFALGLEFLGCTDAWVIR